MYISKSIENNTNSNNHKRVNLNLTTKFQKQNGDKIALGNKEKEKSKQQKYLTLGVLGAIFSVVGAAALALKYKKKINKAQVKNILSDESTQIASKLKTKSKISEQASISQIEAKTENKNAQINKIPKKVTKPNKEIEKITNNAETKATEKPKQIVSERKTECPTNQSAAINKIESLTENKKIQLGKISVKPIETDEEFEQIYDKLSKTDFWQSRWSVKGADKYDHSINIYAGYMDISDRINRFLSSGNPPNPEWNPELTKERMEDGIRLLEYSLAKLDKKVGTYKGIVYREGWFNPEGNQYFSTAAEISGVSRRNTDLRERPLSIIFTKNGHKIKSFQEKLSPVSEMAKEFIKEHEILLPITNKYKQLEPNTPELEKLVDDFAKTICWQRVKDDKQNFIDLIKKRIKIYEQI